MEKNMFRNIKDRFPLLTNQIILYFQDYPKVMKKIKLKIFSEHLYNLQLVCHLSDSSIIEL